MMKTDLIEIEELYINDKDNRIDGEIKLWRAVILQALDDCCLPASNARYKRWRMQARKWFIDVDEDFQIVCELAKLSTAKVLNIAYIRISKQP